MKLNELISQFTIALSNEESEMLERMGNKVNPIHSYTEREQFVIESLVRKALVSKVLNNGMVLVMANEGYKS